MDTIQLIKPIELHAKYPINDCIISRETFIYKIIDTSQLQLIEEYEENTKNLRIVRFLRRKYYVNKDGLKENIYISYYPNGIVESYYHFHNNQLNGKFQTYYECGSLKNEGYYRNDKLHIYKLTFYEPSAKANQLMAYVEYSDDKIAGRYSFYTLNGELFRERYILENSELLDIVSPVVTIQGLLKDNNSYVIRKIRENNKIVVSSIYQKKKYQNDMLEYYVFYRHVGFLPTEKIDDSKILFLYEYIREEGKTDISICGNINQFIKYSF